VEERAGRCVLTVPDWRTTDSGNYYVVFPAQLADNTKIAVTVKGTLLWWPWVTGGILLGILGAAVAAFIKCKKGYTKVKKQDDVEAANKITPERRKIRKDFVKDKIEQFEGVKRPHSDSDNNEHGLPPKKRRKLMIGDNCFPTASCFTGNDSTLGAASPEIQTGGKKPKDSPPCLVRGQPRGQSVGPASA
jgi:hypothetical protein